MDLELSNHNEQTALTDVQLWQSLSQGQTDALGILYDRHGGLVYGIALKVLTHPQEAEDLTQDIFVKLMATSYDPRRGSLRTFLAILTRSRAIDRLRSRQREHRRNQKFWQTAPLSTPGASDLEENTLQEQSQGIRAALKQLSEEQQQLLKMSFYEGLTQTTIADQLDLPLGTVKSRVRRGLLKLRQILQDQLD